MKKIKLHLIFKFLERKKFHPIFKFLKRTMRKHKRHGKTRMDLEHPNGEIKTEIHNPNIPNGEHFFFIRVHLKNEPEEIKLYPKTGVCEISLGDIKEKYTPRDIANDELTTAQLDDLMNDIRHHQPINLW